MFTQFPNLPPEVRLMIWEETWPESRIIEPVLVKNPDSTGDTGARLKPRCTLSAWLAHDQGPLRHGPAPRDPCEDSVALRVNAESRAHTLSAHVYMQHSPNDEHSFYFSPRRDYLWFTADPMLGFNRAVVLAASGAYGGCWGQIEMILGGPRMYELYATCVRDAKNIFGPLPD